MRVVGVFDLPDPALAIAGGVVGPLGGFFRYVGAGLIHPAGGSPTREIGAMGF